MKTDEKLTFRGLRRQGNGPIKLLVEYSDGSAVLDFEGARTTISCDHPFHREPEAYDFALFAAAICSMQTGREVVLDKPVTAGALSSIAHLAEMFALWRLPRIYPPRVTASMRDGPTPEGTETAICLSGGVDSTYSAYRNARQSGARYAILLHGADYLDEDRAAFEELEGRVRKTAAQFDLDLVMVRFDIKNLGINWEMLHGIFFAAALHFVSPALGRVFFALDYTLWQDYVTHPWGSSHALISSLSGDGLAIEATGGDATRMEKILALSEHSDLIANLSVCYGDRSTGHNCGTCRKCIRTRVALEVAGIDPSGLFIELPDLKAALAADKVPMTPKTARSYYVFASDICRFAPEGEIKDLLRRKMDKAWRYAAMPRPSSFPATRMFREAGDAVKGLLGI